MTALPNISLEINNFTKILNSKFRDLQDSNFRFVTSCSVLDMQHSPNFFFLENRLFMLRRKQHTAKRHKKLDV